MGRHAEREQPGRNAPPRAVRDREMETGRRNEKDRVAVIKTKLFLFLLLILVCTGAAAQTGYPSKPVRFIVPSAAGGGTDIIARALAQNLSESLARQFVVDNRPGAGQMI